jgi:hypothetical protein
LVSNIEEHRVRVFESRVLRRIFGPKKDAVTGVEKNCITRSFMFCFTKYNQNNQVKEDEMGKSCSTNGGRKGTSIGYW